MAALAGHSVQLECIFFLDGDSLYTIIYTYIYK